MSGKKKKLTTRRRRALRWVAALALILTAGLLSGVYCLTPTHALREVEQAYLCGRTEWLCRLPEIPGAKRQGELRLSVGEHAALLGEYVFSWKQGWRSAFSVVLERETERPFSAGLYSRMVSLDEKDHTRYFWIYGVLESPDAAELEIAFVAREGGYDQTVRLTEADWITTDAGDRCFLCALEPENDLYSFACYITAYRADGTDLGTLEAAGIPRWQ